MNHDILKNFITLDQEVFTQVAKHYGYSSAAIYRLIGRNLVYILGTQSEEGVRWPASAAFSSDYTPRRGVGLPLGWVKPAFALETKRVWPKAISFYYPAQDWSSVKLVFVVRNAAGKRTRLGELDGPWEALAARISAWIDQGEVRHFVSESHFLEQMRRVNVEVQYLMDHELRTPLTSILGYAELLTENDHATVADYARIINGEGQRALGSLTRLAEALRDSLGKVGEKDLCILELASLCEELAEGLREQAPAIANELLSGRLNVTVRVPGDQQLQVRGIPNLMKTAIWEVLKNAAAFAAAGRIDLTIYSSDQMVVLDVEDDGGGVSPGAEDLIFLRFFQGPQAKGTRRVKKGLGIGLYLARCIVEQHGGSLTFVRGVGRHGVFRFLWPRHEAEQTPLLLESAS